MIEPLSDSQTVVRAAAFRLLVTHGEPVAPEALAAETGIHVDDVASLTDRLERAGRIRRDKYGRVVGSAGLSVVPDRHEIDLEGRRFWTWCAYDILGIFGALRANGLARSPSPGGPLIGIHFRDGLPRPSVAVLFRPDTELMAGCENVYEEWCPNSNLFVDEEQAEKWARERELEGRVLGLTDASTLATKEWLPLVIGGLAP